MNNKIIKLLAISTMIVAMIPIIYLGTNKKEKVAANDNIPVAFFDAEAYMQTDEFKNKMNEELHKAYGDNYKEVLAKNNLASEKAQKIEEMFTIHTTGEKIYPDYYGGMYIDDNDELVLQIVKQNIPLKQNNTLYEKYNRLVTEKEYDKIEYVENSYNELNELRQSIISKNINFNAMYIDVFTNKLIIEYSKEQSEDISKIIKPNNFIKITIKKTTRGLATSTLYPGDNLTSLSGDKCTYGYRSKMGNIDGFITAGHCDCLRSIGQDYGLYGTITKRSISGNADALFVAKNNNYSLSNYFNKQYPPKTFTAYTGSNYYVPGAKVGKYGSVTKYLTGTINNNNLTFSYTVATVNGNKTITIQDMYLLNMNTEVGDSGGPVFTLDQNPQIIGIISAKYNSQSTATKYSNIVNTLGAVLY